MKIENAAKPSLLQPLPIEVWVDISMDFITDLPKSMEKEVIFVVVGRFSKAAQFMALSHPFTAIQVARSYLDNVFKLHGWPKSFVSDNDSVFLLVISRKAYSLFMVLNSLCLLLINVRQMDKLKW